MSCPRPPAPAGFPGLPAYAELHCRTNFSFQVGASHAEELVARAHALGYTALAITDECSVAGLVRAHAEAKKLGLKLLAGSEFVLDGGDGRFRLIALAHNLNGWGALCEFITAGRRAAPKGEYRLGWQDVTAERLPDCELILAPDRLTRSAITLEALCDRLTLGRRQFGSNFWLAAELLHGLDDDLWLTQLEEASARTGVPLVAAGDVLMHVRSRKLLHDVLTAVRLGTPVAAVRLRPAAQRRGAPAPAPAPGRALPARAAGPHARWWPRAAASAWTSCATSTRMETVLPGTTPAQTLRHHTRRGRARALPAGRARPGAEADRARAGADRRAAVRDVLPHRARPRALCARRAASCARGAARRPTRRSATAWASPRSTRRACSVLFERFISRERNEPPDIDVDFEHQRREEVIQYIYAKYGRERAALTAVVISYRPRSALRDVGRALGMDLAQIDALAKEHYWFDGSEGAAQRVRDAGLDPDDLRVRQWLETAAQLLGFPRHLSQHVGGFVLDAGPAHAPGAGGKRRHAGALHHPVGQGRPRRRGPAQGRRAGPGHAQRHPPLPGRWSSARRGVRLPHAGHPRRRPRHLRHDLRAPTPWACSRSKAARR